ncbi:hypothetical protein FXO38_06381 [Capsicum annuum]|uniref:Uncharacterized protein n=1 Tax=Capsicum annuum TaxID=4072 RepID=A0A2G3AME9_CAPAN|nr:hypothetical protein FXO37_09374 [Capsicum annuum]KAF3671936.1 hypothetical protein FXO38_06381 [Capsicum annuum]PHT95417.1 hypothetical protein T459_03299 [Capsicum annuum]
MGNFVDLVHAIAGNKGFGHMDARYILGTGMVEWNIKGFVKGSNGEEEYMELGHRFGLGIEDKGKMVFWDRNGFQLRQSPRPLSSFISKYARSTLNRLCGGFQYGKTHYSAGLDFVLYHLPHFEDFNKRLSHCLK